MFIFCVRNHLISTQMPIHCSFLILFSWKCTHTTAAAVYRNTALANVILIKIYKLNIYVPPSMEFLEFASASHF